MLDECSDVGAEEHLALTDTDYERCRAARGDNRVRMISVREDERERTFQPTNHRQRTLDEITCRRPLGVRPGDEVNRDLGIRVALQFDACSLELRTQRGKILDDSVVNDSQLARGITMRVRIAVRRTPMRRPTGMAHTGRTDEVIRTVLAELRLEVGQLTGLTLDLDPTGSVENRDSRRVVPAILHSSQSLHHNAQSWRWPTYPTIPHMVTQGTWTSAVGAFCGSRTWLQRPLRIHEAAHRITSSTVAPKLKTLDP